MICDDRCAALPITIIELRLTEWLLLAVFRAV
jgi:hypothetical protein